MRTLLLQPLTAVLAWLALGASLRVALLLTWRRLTPITGAVDTVVTTGAAEAAKIWGARIWVEAVRAIYFSQFMKDNDQNAIIEVHRDLEKQGGDQETFTLARKLSGPGVDDDNILEGNEEELDFFSDTVTLKQKRNAVRLGGRMSEKRTRFSQRTIGKNQLKSWMAETLDDDCFTQFDTTPTSVIFGGNATSTADVGADDKFTPDLIDRAIARAKKAAPKIHGVQVGGKVWYVVVLHTDVAFDLKANDAWKQAQREATPRDKMDNAIFSGALGYWGGAVVHEHEKVPTAINWGAGADQPGASNMFLGRQAGLMAWGAMAQAWEKGFDYDSKRGFAIGAIWGFTKAVFDGNDHAYQALRTYRTNT